MEDIWLVFLGYYGYLIMQVIFVVTILLVMYWGFNLVFAIANKEDSNRQEVKELVQRNGTRIGVSILSLGLLFLGINYSTTLVETVNKESYLDNNDKLKEGIVEDAKESLNEWDRIKINNETYIVDKYNQKLDGRVGNKISYITYDGYYFNKVNKLQKGKMLRTVSVLEINEDNNNRGIRSK